MTNYYKLLSKFDKQLKIDNNAKVSTVLTDDAEYLVLTFDNGKVFYFTDGEYAEIPITKIYGKAIKR
jgi:hypothetical protein